MADHYLLNKYIYYSALSLLNPYGKPSQRRSKISSASQIWNYWISFDSRWHNLTQYGTKSELKWVENMKMSEYIINDISGRIISSYTYLDYLDGFPRPMDQHYETANNPRLGRYTTLQNSDTNLILPECLHRYKFKRIKNKFKGRYCVLSLYQVIQVTVKTFIIFFKRKLR